MSRDISPANAKLLKSKDLPISTSNSSIDKSMDKTEDE